ncbi:MAG: lipoate protein ligase C-terminal domain-containing protein [Thermoplasmata archaeon]
MKFEYKDKGSKLIRLDIDWENGRIKKINIYGDFFLHPEESIFKLEKNLEGKDIYLAKKVIDEFFKSVEYAGIDPESLYQAIKESMVK